MSEAVWSLLGLPGRWAWTAFGRQWVRDSDVDGAATGRVLFVHGLGRGGAQLAPLALAFRSVRRVLVPDLFDLGGRSRARHGPLTIVEQADALGQLLDAHGPADVVGVSLGGWVAAWLAARRPELVEGLYLVNPAGARAGAEEIGALYRQTAHRESLYRRTVSGRPFVGVPIVSRLIQRGFSRVLQAPDTIALLEGVTEDHFVEQALPAIRCRVRLLLAEQDRLLSSAETLRVWSSAVSGLEGAWVQGASHNLGYEAFEVLLDDLAGYLGLDRPPATTIATLASHLRVPPPVRAFGGHAR